MCGITGAYFFQEGTAEWRSALETAVERLSHRGPDATGTFGDHRVLLGHSRLSVIDTSDAGHQPMSSADGRYTLVFNGEIYNYAHLRSRLQKQGYTFTTASDTEVLLYALVAWKEAALEQLHGFFAFAFYDATRSSLLLARDRMGIKPLYVAEQSDALVFASEVQALLAYPIARQLDYTALWSYLQLNYSPGPATLLQGVTQLLPGHYLHISAGEKVMKPYYTLPYSSPITAAPAYDDAQDQLVDLLDQSVQERLVADVPLGAFLSGGIDSSVIVALASRHVEQLHTFSVGFKDHAFHDETAYAQMVAKRFNTQHHAFYLTEEDLFRSLQQILAHGDHPFADSSAILVNALSEAVRPHVTVALSGDGGDELFGGYHKYRGEWIARNGGISTSLVKAGYPLWSVLPKSRSGKWSNRFRQLHRFAEGARLSPAERYWRWCGVVGEGTARQLLSRAAQSSIDEQLYSQQKAYYTHHIDPKDMNSVLYADTQLVLPNDMLTKVDRMSMLHHLEVRVPFLDHRIAAWAFSLPEQYKVTRDYKKRLLKDAFRDMLPEALYHRPKQGFEVPILAWMRGPLKDMLFNDLLHPDRVEAQGIFKVKPVEGIKKQLLSRNPGDAPARLYGLLQFQNWYFKWMRG